MVTLLNEQTIRSLPKEYLQDLLTAKRREVQEAQLQETELRNILRICEKNLVKKRERLREAEAYLKLVRQEEIRRKRKRPNSPEIDIIGWAEILGLNWCRPWITPYRVPWDEWQEMGGTGADTLMLSSLTISERGEKKCGNRRLSPGSTDNHHRLVGHAIRVALLLLLLLLLPLLRLTDHMDHIFAR
jgi:hypothetical protein